MRILVVSDLFPPVAFGGYERECATVVRHLMRRHEVCVLTSRRGGRAHPPQAGVRRELPSLWGPRLAVNLRAPFATAGAARTVHRVLDTFEPDLAYVWGLQTVPHAALAVLAQREVPIAYRLAVPWAAAVYTGDRFMRYLGPPGQRRNGAFGIAVRAVNRLPALRIDGRRPVRAALSWASEALRSSVSVSRAVEPTLERTFWPATDQTGRLATMARNPPPRPTIAFIGRVLAEKGPHIAYRALGLLRGRYGLDAQLIVAGWAPAASRKRLRALSQQLGIAEHVTIVGPVEGTALEAVYQSAHAVVVPSLWSEPLGLVCIEAALARVPVVASRIGGIPEALRHGEEALLFEAGDVEACAAAMASVFADPEEAQRRVDRAFRRAMEDFSVERYLDQTDAFLMDSLHAWHRVEASPET